MCKDCGKYRDCCKSDDDWIRCKNGFKQQNWKCIWLYSDRRYPNNKDICVKYYDELNVKNVQKRQM